MKYLILLIALIVFAGCGHTHPIAEHEHPHEHDHTHESEAEALHKELVGKYLLDAYKDERDRIVGNDEQMRGKLTIGLDYNFEIVIEEDLNYDNPLDSEWDSVRPFYPYYGDSKYYKILTDRSAILTYESALMRLRDNGDLRWHYGNLLEYKWDGMVLILIWHSSLRDNHITMKWRKLR